MAAWALILLLRLALCCSSVAGFWDGIVSLDRYSFDAVVYDEGTAGVPRDGVEPLGYLVKFERKHGAGEPLKQWRNFAEAIGKLSVRPQSSSLFLKSNLRGNASVGGANGRKEKGSKPASRFEDDVVLESMSGGASRLVIGEVNCHNEIWHDDREHFNMEFAERFQVQFPATDYYGFKPAVKVFLRPGETCPNQTSRRIINFTDVLTTNNLLRFLQREVPFIRLRLKGSVPDAEPIARDYCRFLPPRNPNPQPNPNVPSLSSEITAISEALLRQLRRASKDMRALARGLDSQDKQQADYYLTVMNGVLDEANERLRGWVRDASSLQLDGVTAGRDLRDLYYQWCAAFLGRERLRLERMLYPRGQDALARSLMKGDVTYEDAGASELLTPDAQKREALERKLDVVSAFKLVPPHWLDPDDPDFCRSSP